MKENVHLIYVENNDTLDQERKILIQEATELMKILSTIIKNFKSNNDV